MILDAIFAWMIFIVSSDVPGRCVRCEQGTFEPRDPGTASHAASIHCWRRQLEMPGVPGPEVAQPGSGVLCLPCEDMGICGQV